MLIGELSIKTGFSRDTIRFYEKQGLIKVGRKDRRNNNYKEYSEEVLNRLLMIRKVKNFGFTLNEVVEILDMISAQTASCDNMSQKMSEKINVIEQKIQELQNIKSLMIKGINQCQSSCISIEKENNCGILVDDLLITILR